MIVESRLLAANLPGETILAVFQRAYRRFEFSINLADENGDGFRF